MLSILRVTPRHFIMLSLVLVTALVAGTGFVLSRFFHQAIIDREGRIISDMTHALASRDVTLKDFSDFRTQKAQQDFKRSFGALKDIEDVVRIKVYDLKGGIVWSDDASLVGVQASPTGSMRQAAIGNASGVVNGEPLQEPQENGASLPPVVKFVVPIFIHKTASSEPEVIGVMELYRSSVNLNATIEHGVRLVWMVTAIGGIALFGALFALFRSVWQGREEAESRLMRLSGEHHRIIHLEKLSAAGTMVGEIAHQINNPLVGVINLAQLAEREIDDTARTRELLRDIKRAGEHCSTFVERMLAFTQAARCELQQVSLVGLVTDTVTLFQESMSPRPLVETRFPQDNAIIQADPVLVRHALFNILQNAFQAAPDAPIEIDLTAENCTSTFRKGWLLEISDHGPGIPQKDRKRVFTPFFTTKPEGMGLGLAVVEHIIMQHNGDIVIENTPEGGARASIWLPEKE